MTSLQHKILSIVLISSITIMGFESLAYIAMTNQFAIYLHVAIYVYLFHVFWVAFIFDLQLKRVSAIEITSARFRELIRTALIRRFRHALNIQYLRHYFHYMILPTILFWSTVALIFLNAFDPAIKQILVATAVLCLVGGYWLTKEHLLLDFEPRRDWLGRLTTIKLATAFLAFAAVFGLCFQNALPVTVVCYLIFGVSFFLMQQVLVLHNLHRLKTLAFIFASALVCGIAGIWVYHNWTYQYFTSALIILCLYNIAWGLIRHFLDRTLSQKLVFEYVLLTLLLLSIIISGHNFSSGVV